MWWYMYCSVEWFGRVWKVWGTWEENSRQMPGSQMSWKTLESPGSNQWHLSDWKIALYQLSQILNYKTDGSLVNLLGAYLSNQRRKPHRMLTFEGMPIVWRTSSCTLQHFQDSQAYVMHAGTVAREHTAAKRGHRLFFWSEKKGVRPHPPNPLGYVPVKWSSYWVPWRDGHAEKTQGC